MSDPRRTLLALVCAVAGMTAAAEAQQGRVYPPVPGPFFIAPPMPTAPMMPAAPGAPAPQAPNASAPAPLYGAPAAMRMPYWMQPGQPAPVGATPQGVETAPSGGAGVGVGGAVEGGGSTGVGYGQGNAPGAFPTYGAPRPPMPGQPMQGQPAQGQQGFMPPQPGWGYGAQPGWAAQPYAPGPGWGGWGQPAPRAGN